MVSGGGRRRRRCQRRSLWRRRRAGTPRRSRGRGPSGAARLASLGALTALELAAYLGPFPTPASRLPTWIFAREIRGSAAYLAEVEAGLARLADTPALIVWGDADGAFRAPDRDRFARLFPDHHVVNLPGAKHFIQENAPDAIAAAIRDWEQERAAPR